MSLDLNVGDERRAGLRQTREHGYRPVLVRVSGADQIHRHVGVHEDHEAVRLASMSRSMSSMSAVGNSCCAAAAIARSLVLVESEGRFESLRASRIA